MRAYGKQNVGDWKFVAKCFYSLNFIGNTHWISLNTRRRNLEKLAMKSFAELAPSEKRIKELTRRDSIRRSCVQEITRRINEERKRDNEAKVQKYIWEKQVGRAEAVKVLKKHKDKRERIWPPYTERAIHFKTIHLTQEDLRDLLDQCNKWEKDGKSFGFVFNSYLKVHR